MWPGSFRHPTWDERRIAPRGGPQSIAPRSISSVCSPLLLRVGRGGIGWSPRPGRTGGRSPVDGNRKVKVVGQVLWEGSGMDLAVRGVSIGCPLEPLFTTG